MRLIRLKIKPAVKDALFEVSTQFRTGDRGFVEDLYALLRRKGHGLPSKERTEKLIEHVAKAAQISPTNARILVMKRLQSLKQTATMAYFKALQSLPDPVDAIRRVLLNFQLLYLKYRQAQCVTCPHIQQCDFGRQYQHASVDIRRVIDVDFRKKVNPNCPVLPQIDLTNQVAEAMKTFKLMMAKQQAEAEMNDIDAEKLEEAEEDAEEDMLAKDTDEDLMEESLEGESEQFGVGVPSDDKGEGRNDDSSRYKGGHTGREYVRQFENMVNDLTLQQLVIFEIGRKFDMSLLTDKQGEFKPTEVMEQDKREENIEHVSEIPKLVASQFALPDEVFDQRMEQRALQKRQDMKRVAKKKLLYLLIDNSSSMNQQLHGNIHGLLSRGALATVFSISLTRRVRDDGGIVFFRYFAGAPSSRMEARDKEGFETTLKHMAHADFDGGSTAILKAVKAAVKDIQTAQDEIAKSEIVLISDCEDSFNPATIKQTLDKVPLHILDVSGTANALQYDASNSLKGCADKYYRINPQTVDIQKMVELL